MADELSNVQASQGVNPLWPLGAAAAGFGATYYGLNKTGYSSSPYKTVEDLIKEKEDTFNGKKVNGDAQQKAIDKAQNTFKTAVEKYDADFEAYKANPANVYELKENPEFKALLEKQAAAEKALADKKAELEKIGTDGKKAEVSPKAQQVLDKVKKELETESKKLEKFSKLYNESLKEIADEMYKSVTEIENLESEIRDAIRDKKPAAEIEALKAELKASREAFKTVEADLDKTLQATAEMMITSGKKSEVEAQRKAKIKEIKTTLQDMIAERTNNESVIKSNVKEIETSKKEALKVIDKTVGTTLSKSEMPEIEKQVGRHIKVEEKKLAKLENFKNLFAEAEKKVKVSGGESTVIEELCKVLSIFEKSKISTTVKSVENYFADSLKPEEVEDFFRLVKSGTGAEAIDKAIKDSKDKIQTLENSLNSVKSAEAQIVKLGGEGAYIKKGVLYGADNKKVEFKPQQVKLANNVEVPETKKMRGLRHQIEKIEAEINKSTGEKLTAQEIEAKLANETKAVADAKSAVEKAREGLEKGVAKTPEQLKEEFTKLNGSKREAITKALNESKEELKPLFEKKWGSGKVAAAITGGAVVAGLLGYLIAPKRNS